jgi:hypothetical protein
MRWKGESAVMFAKLKSVPFASSRRRESKIIRLRTQTQSEQQQHNCAQRPPTILISRRKNACSLCVKWISFQTLLCLRAKLKVAGRSTALCQNVVYLVLDFCAERKEPNKFTVNTLLYSICGSHFDQITFKLTPKILYFIISYEQKRLSW